MTKALVPLFKQRYLFRVKVGESNNVEVVGRYRLYDLLFHLLARNVIAVKESDYISAAGVLDKAHIKLHPLCRTVLRRISNSTVNGVFSGVKAGEKPLPVEPHRVFLGVFRPDHMVA